jgi:hypothetical protein
MTMNNDVNDDEGAVVRCLRKKYLKYCDESPEQRVEVLSLVTRLTLAMKSWVVIAELTAEQVHAEYTEHVEHTFIQCIYTQTVTV